MKRNDKMLDMLDEMADEREEAARVKAQQAERSHCLQTWLELPFTEPHLLPHHCINMKAQQNTYIWMVCVMEWEEWEFYFDGDGNARH